MPKHKGFTLIELLVVITILSILAAIGLVTYSGLSKRARDAARVELMNDVKNALGQYNVANGKYPKTGAGGDVGTDTGLPNCADFTDWSQGGFGGLLNLLGRQGYIKSPVIDSGKDISCGALNGSDPNQLTWGDIGKGATLGGAPICGWNHCYIFGSNSSNPWPAGYHYWSDGSSYKLILIKEDGTKYMISQ